MNTQKTLHEFAEALAAGETTSVELVERALERAGKSRNTFILLRSEASLKEAEQASARWRAGKPLSPLDGIPIAWKDLFDIKGTITTAGSRAIAMKATAAERDAAVVQNTRSLGLIPLGKTNLTELAYSGLGLNPHYGTPGDGVRVPGGSSSGSAIAVKDGVVAAAVGTDTAGSIRIPAALNGLVGFKSSSSRYDMSGVFPLQRSFDSLGPICHTVDDCVIMDAAMRGMAKPDVSPAAAAPNFIVDVGVAEDPDVTEAVRGNFAAFVQQLKDAGACVEHRRMDAVERSRTAFHTIGWLGSPEAYALHKDLIASPARTLMDARVADRLEMAGALGAEAVATLSKLRTELMEHIIRELDGAMLLMPTVKHVAPPLKELETDTKLFGRVNIATLSLTMIGSFLNMPGVALPTCRDVGAETSALLSGAFGCDDVVLSAALWVENSTQNGATVYDDRLAGDVGGKIRREEKV